MKSITWRARFFNQIPKIALQGGCPARSRYAIRRGGLRAGVSRRKIGIWV
jgi:hypothetical protein